MNASPRFCNHCGAPLKVGVRFCNQCGTSVVQSAPTAPPVPAYTPPPPPPRQAPVFATPPAPQQVPLYAGPPAPQRAVGYPAQQQSEPVLSLTPGLTRQRGFLGMASDTFTLVMTPSRLIFAFLDPKAMKQLVAEAREEAKAQGKGMLGQWAAQMGWLNLLMRRYEAMSADAILAQTPGSFTIPNAAVSRIRIRHVSSNSNEPQIRDQTQIVIDTTAGKYRFTLPSSMGISHREIKQRLQQTLGGMVK